ncbi:hypothetical protein H2204_001546 [Knufia peltigerae]|uniref:Uncharacterized protein n=1 Tax=Knufia peltigerae TaxID=1002370 RepID=A0AA38YCG4_9EURO|nr:hypothetical protein H2204_001546 [Knufia peltigerae]
MPPIPVHTASPINNNAPSDLFGTSPSTAAARYTPPSAEASPTATQPTSTYPAARPGAPAVPQPTNAASVTYNNRLQPTATATLPTPTATSNAPLSDSPPPPQPGAVPSPYPTAYNTPTLSIPQPPIPGPHPQHTPTSSVTSPVRHALPSPTPTRPSPVPFTPQQQFQDLSHPPGYMQDSRASFDDKPVEDCQPYENRASPSSTSRRGILDSEPVFDNRGDNDSFLNTAMSWAKAAGKSLSKTEQEIWKHMNGED